MVPSLWAIKSKVMPLPLKLDKSNTPDPPDVTVLKYLILLFVSRLIVLELFPIVTVDELISLNNKDSDLPESVTVIPPVSLS